MTERGFKKVRKAFASKGDDATFSRFVKEPGTALGSRKAPNGQLWLPDLRHKALELGTTIFNKRGVKTVSEVKNVLVSGHCNVKIGRDVRIGPLNGYWIYYATLEERKTCPRTCHHWQDCYGNNMPYAKRVRHGPELIAKLAKEIPTLLLVRGRVGVLIRLHALGDFYSEEYVEFWARMLRTYGNLAVFGYTAWHPGTEIGDAIAKVKKRFGRRFSIRWSDGGFGRDCTVSINEPSERPATAFICPEQLGRVDGCGKCGLCWGTDKDVAFIGH